MSMSGPHDGENREKQTTPAGETIPVPEREAVIAALRKVAKADPTLSPERIASIQRGIAEAQAGRTRPAAEVLAELGLDEEHETNDTD
jgi:hypothetical protein